MYVFPPSPQTQLTPPGPERSNILPLRLARPRPPSPLRNLRNPDLVNTRNRNPPNVRRPNGLRSPQLRSQARAQRRTTGTDAWKGLWDAQLAFTIRGFFLVELESVFTV